MGGAIKRAVGMGRVERDRMEGEWTLFILNLENFSLYFENIWEKALVRVTK